MASAVGETAGPAVRCHTWGVEEAQRPSAIVEARREEILAICGRHKVVPPVRVFGSVARGEDGSTSDVDLLVRFAPGASIFYQVNLRDELQDLLGIRVDVISEGGLVGGLSDPLVADARTL